MGRKSIIPEIESKHGKPIQQILTELTLEYDYKEISTQLGIKKSLVYRLLKRYGIKTKSRSKPEDISSEGELGEIINSFIMSKELAGLTKSALRFYRDNLRRFTWWLVNETKMPQELAVINTDVIRKFLYYVQTSDVRFGGYSTASRKPANRSTLDAYWRTFQAFTSWLIREGYIKKDENPMDRIDRPKQLKVVIPELPEDIIKAILRSFEDDFNGRRDRAIILVLLDSGMRLGELVGIKLQDLDFKTGLVKIFGKGQKERIVSLSPPVIGAIKRYLELREDDSPWLWTTYDGKQFSWWGTDNMIRGLKKKLNLPKSIKLSAHVFRHTFAIVYLRNGGDPFTLQDIGGWEDLNMPNRYARARKQEDAHKVHAKASPVMHLFEDGENDESESDENSGVRPPLEIEG